MSAAGDPECKACGAGLHTGEANQSNVCLSCGTGKYSNAIGASSSGVCQDCPEGTFSSALGVTSLDLCNACPAGTASNVSGAGGRSVCEPCAPGHYASGEGTEVCTVCEVGKVADAGASMCSLCQATHIYFHFRLLSFISSVPPPLSVLLVMQSEFAYTLTS